MLDKKITEFLFCIGKLWVTTMIIIAALQVNKTNQNFSVVMALAALAIWPLDWVAGIIRAGKGYTYENDPAHREYLKMAGAMGTLGACVTAAWWLHSIGVIP